MEPQLDTEVEAPRAHVRIAREPWEAVWPALRELTEKHALEVEPASQRKIRPDARRLAEAVRLGFVRIHTLRVDGELWGYISWNVMWDLESEGLPIATQGAWFVRDGAPFGAGVKLFSESVWGTQGLTSVGIQCIFPHHRMLGRGKAIGKFFRSLGAVKTQETYMLWIGEGEDAQS